MDENTVQTEEVQEKTEEVSAPKKVEIPVLHVDLEGFKVLFQNVQPSISTATREHNPAKKHGNSQPKKNAGKIDKKSRKASKNSRRINRGK